MELRQLEHFVAVAEEESFTRAARRLGYVQSALSVSVQTIERELDVRLFDRNTHNTRLTDAGRQLLPSARATLAAAAEVRARAAAVNGVISGRLSIGIMQSFNYLDVPALLGRFHQEHPGVEISMHPAMGGASELLAQVADGTVDVSFVSATNVPPGVDVHRLVLEELMLIAAPDDALAPGGPLALADLGEASFIDVPHRWGMRTEVDRTFAQLGLHRRVAIEVADIPTLLGLVAHGLGVALAPPTMVPPGLSLIQRPTTPAISWEIVVATPANRQPSAAAEAFLAMVADAEAVRRSG